MKTDRRGLPVIIPGCAPHAWAADVKTAQPLCDPTPAAGQGLADRRSEQVRNARRASIFIHAALLSLRACGAPA